MTRVKHAQVVGKQDHSEFHEDEKDKKILGERKFKLKNQQLQFQLCQCCVTPKWHGSELYRYQCTLVANCHQINFYLFSMILHIIGNYVINSWEN